MLRRSAAIRDRWSEPESDRYEGVKAEPAAKCWVTRFPRKSGTFPDKSKRPHRVLSRVIIQAEPEKEIRKRRSAMKYLPDEQTVLKLM